MTNLERFVELYRSFGIECKVFEASRHISEDYKTWMPEKSKRIILGLGLGYSSEECTDSDKFDGYSGFYSEVIFDMDGKFIKQTFYE